MNDVVDQAVALVTGGRQGIGRGIAQCLAKAGFRVVVNDLVDDEIAAETMAGISRAGGEARFLQADIADLDAQEAFVERAWDCFGRIDCLVNNAGVSVRVRGDLLDVSVESYDRVMSVNTRAPFFLTQRIARRMLADKSPPHYRSIVNISSASAVVVGTRLGEYCMSKAALSMASNLFAARLGEAGIGVHDLRPGFIRTDITSHSAARYDAMIAEGFTPFRRWGTPADVGRAVVALARGDFSFSTGGAMYVDGGQHIRQL